jgi:hypothetical protein
MPKKDKKERKIDKPLEFGSFHFSFFSYSFLGVLGVLVVPLSRGSTGDLT